MIMREQKRKKEKGEGGEEEEERRKKGKEEEKEKEKKGGIFCGKCSIGRSKKEWREDRERGTILHSTVLEREKCLVGFIQL